MYIPLMHAINYFNSVLMHQFNRFIYVRLPSATDYTSRLQDATTVKLAIKQFY